MAVHVVVPATLADCDASHEAQLSMIALPAFFLPAATDQFAAARADASNLGIPTSDLVVVLRRLII